MQPFAFVPSQLPPQLLPSRLHGVRTPCGAPVRVNTTVNGDQSRPAVAAFGDDAFVVAWTDHSGGPPDASASDVRARVFYADLEGCR